MWGNCSGGWSTMDSSKFPSIRWVLNRLLIKARFRSPSICVPSLRNCCYFTFSRWRNQKAIEWSTRSFNPTTLFSTPSANLTTTQVFVLNPRGHLRLSSTQPLTTLKAPGNKNGSITMERDCALMRMPSALYSTTFNVHAMGNAIVHRRG